MHPAWLRRAQRRRSAGFSLVELMTVVLITGVLAAIGVVLVTKHFAQARANQALVGLQAIRIGEESYRAHNGQYLDCSPDRIWYPTGNLPGKRKYDWRQPGRNEDDGSGTQTVYQCWGALGVMRPGEGTMFGYLVDAGRPGDPYPAYATQTQLSYPTPAPDLWYIIQYKGDTDGNGKFSYGVTSSYNADVYIQDELE